MKKIIALLTLLIMLPTGLVSAQSMMMGKGATTTDDHTAKEEALGKAVWDKINKGTIACGALSDDQFALLGEYFMGQMMGDSHVFMNERITQMIGADGEENVHITLGKRLSNCDKNAAFPAGTESFVMPMMGGSFDTWAGIDDSSPWGSANNYRHMYGGYHDFGMGAWGWLGEALWWVLVIAGIIFLIRHFGKKHHGSFLGRGAIEVLKERYAKGEIDKSEFESKKRDLSS